jgi:hypothetical protein
MAEILSSIRGNKLGLGPAGRLLVNPYFTGPVPTWLSVYGATAASTALSNFTSQRAFDNGYFTIPANTLQVGSQIRIRFQGIQTAVNGTDTMQPILSIGVTLGASLAVTGGTALLTTTATAGANGLVFHGEYNLSIRTVGSSGTMIGWGVYKKVPAAEATYSAVDDILASTTIDTTAAQIIAVGLAYGAASSSNSTRLDHFTVDMA